MAKFKISSFLSWRLSFGCEIVVCCGLILSTAGCKLGTPYFAKPPAFEAEFHGRTSEAVLKDASGREHSVIRLFVSEIRPVRGEPLPDIILTNYLLIDHKRRPFFNRKYAGNEMVIRGEPSRQWPRGMVTESPKSDITRHRQNVIPHIIKVGSLVSWKARNTIKRRLTDWTEEKVILLEPTGAKLKIVAASAVYEIPEAYHTNKIKVTAFFINRTNCWVGASTDYYVSSKDGISGVRLNSHGSIFWANSLVETAQSLDDLKMRFEKTSSAAEVLESRVPGLEEQKVRVGGTVTYIRDFLSPFFFMTGNGASSYGKATVESVEVKGDTLQITFKSSWGPTALVETDISSRKVIKADEFGSVPFP